MHIAQSGITCKVKVIKMSEKIREIIEMCESLEKENKLDFDYDADLCIEEHIKDLESDY